MAGAVVITGGGSGIGAATARALLDAGREVVVLEINPAAMELESTPGLTVVEGDATRPDDLEKACATAAGTGGLGGFVANASTGAKPGPSAAYDRATWDAVVEMNLSSVFAGAQAAYRHAQGELSFVCVSSLAGYRGLPGLAAYGAAKAAVSGLVRTLAVEWADAGVRVNAVAPGFIATPMFKRGIEAGRFRPETTLPSVPLARFGEPEEVGKVISFLLSPDSSYVTGAVIPVDGGVQARGVPVSE